MLYIPVHLSALFILLVFSIAFFILVTVYAYGKKLQLPMERQKRNLATSILSLFIWLTYTIVITRSGILSDFQSMPPRILLITLPVLIYILLLYWSKKFIELADRVDNFWLVYPQSFRIVMEIILWLLYRYQTIPVQMTFEGRNFDVLAGLTAPFVAYYCFKKKTWSPKIALIWNFAGLLLLGNIVSIAILSTPYPFRYFMNEPANTIIFHFPFVWLPSFVVPFAFFLHLLSIWKLLRKPSLV